MAELQNQRVIIPHSPSARRVWQNWRIRLTLAALCVGLTVVGCGPSNSENSSQEPPGTSQRPAESARGTSPGRPRLTRAGVPPAENDVLLLSYPDDPDTLNPITSSDTVSEAFQSRVYETLAEPRFDNPDEWEPVLAEKWEFDEKNLEFTIHLRKGVKWHPIKLPNGKPLPETELTSRDVTFTFDCVLNPNVEAAHIRSYYEDPTATDESQRAMIEYRAVDKYTVKVRWKKPYFLAKEFTLGGVPIIPRHVFSVNANGEPISFDFSSKEFADGFN
ncbi:MAG: hypothetical protein H5T92_07710, partial [Synergistales bacterium]|nr:hypothetical protein [Synergistales bacterium]